MATGSAGPATKRPRVSSANSTIDRRRFIPAWKSEFPWVVTEEGVMRCQYCVDARKRNIFATTGCDKFKKDALKKHAGTNDHREALEAKSGRRDMQ